MLTGQRSSGQRVVRRMSVLSLSRRRRALKISLKARQNPRVADLGNRNPGPCTEIAVM